MGVDTWKFSTPTKLLSISLVTMIIFTGIPTYTSISCDGSNVTVYRSPGPDSDQRPPEYSCCQRCRWILFGDMELNVTNGGFNWIPGEPFGQYNCLNEGNVIQNEVLIIPESKLS